MEWVQGWARPLAVVEIGVAAGEAAGAAVGGAVRATVGGAFVYAARCCPSVLPVGAARRRSPPGLPVGEPRRDCPSVLPVGAARGWFQGTLPAYCPRALSNISALPVCSTTPTSRQSRLSSSARSSSSRSAP